MPKSRSKKALYNGIYGLIYEFVSIVCGLILPRLILSTFGSKYNGITQSITQFLSFATLLRAGIGAVTKAALYKPIAENDIKKISEIIRATEIFMRRVAFLFAGAMLVLATFYPLIVKKDNFEWIFSFTLVLIIGIGTFAKYYFGMTYQMLLEADQCLYIVSIIHICSTIANVIVAVILIKLGAGIHLVKLGSSIVFALNPIATNIIVKKKYKLLKNVEPDNSAIGQRWDAFAHQVAMIVRDNTDIVILTVVKNTIWVSVYSVYFLVIRAINSMVRAFTNGIAAAFGNMRAKGEVQAMQENLEVYEFLVYSLAAIFYSCVFVLITPFVNVYTRNITDAPYNQPVFGYVMAAAYVFFCIRIPYQNMVEIAGHFKQTKAGAYIESAINLISSIILVYFFGITGVALGTLIALAFRTFQYAIYVAKYIIPRSNWLFFKRLILCVVNMTAIILLCKVIPMHEVTNYLWFAVDGVIVFAISVAITLLLNIIFYKKQMKSFFDKVKNVLFKKSKKIK